MTAGVAYLPEDRHQEGLVLDFTIAQNVTLPILPRLFPRLLLRGATEAKVATDNTQQLSVRMTGVDQEVGALSGGNQQKVVLAKWLATGPRILILDEPTRGIDIGAKVEVHRIIAELAASGLAIILISSDLPEVLAMSDRIVVLHEGRITAEIPRERATQESVMFAATGSLATDEAATALPQRPPARRPMAKAAAVPRQTGQKWLMAIGRQRELSLLAIMFVLGAGVSMLAPQFLTVNNISQVAALAAVVAVAAVGEAIVIITRGIDLSVEAMIGLVAYSIARSLELQLVDPVGALAMGLAIGLGLGMINGLIVAVLKVPAIVATLGTLSIFRGHPLRHRRPRPGPAGRPARGVHGPQPRRHLRDPGVRADRGRRRGRRVPVPALDALRPPGLCGRQQPRGGGHHGHPLAARRLRRVLAVRPAGGPGRRDVGDAVRDDQRHGGDGRVAGHHRGGRGRRRQHPRRVRARSRAPRSAPCSWGSSPTRSSSSASRSSGSRPSTAWSS